VIADIPPDTVRDQIMSHLVKRFEDCIAGQGGRYMTWNAVTDAPLTSAEKVLGNAVGIYDGRERKKPEMGLTRSTLEVQTEFLVKLAMGDNPAKVGRAVLGEVAAVMMSDIYCGGLSLHIVEVGNELDVDGPKDQSVAGIVFWEVYYRHQAGDPRKRQGE
jgi:hypothetical protein